MKAGATGIFCTGGTESSLYLPGTLEIYSVFPMFVLVTQVIDAAFLEFTPVVLGNPSILPANTTYTPCTLFKGYTPDCAEYFVTYWVLGKASSKQYLYP